MKTKLKKWICSILTCAIALTAVWALSTETVSAKESIGNGLILSEDSIAVAKDGSATFTAMLAEGFDASRLACIVADPDVVTITPIAYEANVASYQVSFCSNGSTVAAVYHLDNPAVVAYVNVTASELIMEIPAKLGTNRDNYCTLVSYEFVPYDFSYSDFNDYKSTLKLKYQCASYKDDAYSKWGCYGQFYNADGNVLAKVHLYGSSLAKGRVYDSEFHVPVNAVRFSVEGFE